MDNETLGRSSTGEPKVCQNCKNEFTIEPDDFAFYKKMKVPAPTWCPECRFRRRIIWRNERKLFRGKNALNGENLLTLFPPESEYILYPNNEWRGGYDPLVYGQEVDFTKSFLSQLFELNKKVPKSAGSCIRMVNSEYSDNADSLKNCYLLFNSNFTEDSGYGNGVDHCQLCYDNSHIQTCERCYHSFWLTNCYQTHFSSRCEDCTDVWFSKDCRGCNNCIGCMNLRTKNYCIFNVQYSKEEYQAKLKDFNLSSWKNLADLKKIAQEFWLKFPNKFMQGIKNQNVSGELITHSKNVLYSYLIRECENLRYTQYSQVPHSKDCYDASLTGCNAEQIYESTTCGWGASNIKFSWECWDNALDMEYCMYCRDSSNLFGCSGVQKKQYCILNKQYSKEEYDAMVLKIKKHMDDMPYIDKKGRVYKYGEFFPPEISPFAYSHTISPDHFPLTKEEAIEWGFRWEDANPNEYQTTKDAKELEDNIEDIRPEITKEIIKCEKCGRAYRIIDSELQFLKQMKIPAPRWCVDCRHYDRISQRNRAVFYERKCQCNGENSENKIYKNTVSHFHGQSPCSNKFKTSYVPDRPEIIYCEQCYQQEVA
ncbi:MAG: hypothetical protein WC269_06715 [Candidatus Gracilibacteria bacterium]|jgi:hypothetical protein